MIYLSKGILPWKPGEENVSVSHCGILHKLTGDSAKLWLAGQNKPAYTQSKEQEAALLSLATLGIAEYNDGADDAAVFRLMINCVICPARARTHPVMLTRSESRMLRWLKYAGLRLTLAELTLLAERGIKPVPALLGEQNRQELTELLYSAETIGDGILETMMEKSEARSDTVQVVLGLLRKKKIFMI